MKNIFLHLLFILFTFSACKAPLFNKKRKSEELTFVNKSVATKAEAEKFTFEYLNFKAKASYTDDNGSQNFSMNVRMKADSVIWISVSGLGFEVVRALFLKDSIFIVDRFNKQYFAYDFGYIQQLIKADVTLNQLQQMLVGNTPYDISRYGFKNIENRSGLMELQLNKILNQIALNQLYRPSVTELKSLVETQSLTLTYTNHQRVDKKWFPHQVNVKVFTETSKPELNLSISDVNTDNIDEFPFTIPAKYTKRN